MVDDILEIRQKRREYFSKMDRKDQERQLEETEKEIEQTDFVQLKIIILINEILVDKKLDRSVLKELLKRRKDEK